MDTDVFIVGGGPAGLAAAIAARKKGLSVIVADGARHPIEKACGEGLLPATVQVLRSLGVEFHHGDGHEFRGIRLIDKTGCAHSDFPRGAGLGVSRRKLHQRLVHAAEKSGATLLWNFPVTSIHAHGVHAGGRSFPSRWIVGADGSQSRVAQWSGLARFSRAKHRFARQQHFSVAPWSDYVEIHWGSQSLAYVTPLSKNEVCVAMLTGDPHLRMSELLLEHPELAARLGAQTFSSTERGAITGTRRLHRVARNNVLLIGDASGTVDAITGEGMRLGFEHAVAAVDAIISGDLHEYQRKHRQIARRPGHMAALLQALDGKPRLRGRVFRVLGEAPQLFEKLLALHVGESTLLRSLVAGAGLGWKLLLD